MTLVLLFLRKYWLPLAIGLAVLGAWAYVHSLHAQIAARDETIAKQAARIATLQANQETLETAIADQNAHIDSLATVAEEARTRTAQIEANLNARNTANAARARQETTALRKRLNEVTATQTVCETCDTAIKTIAGVKP